jgi:hypothetical protein
VKRPLLHKPAGENVAKLYYGKEGQAKKFYYLIQKTLLSISCPAGWEKGSIKLTINGKADISTVRCQC